MIVWILMHLISQYKKKLKNLLCIELSKIEKDKITENSYAMFHINEIWSFFYD